MAITFTITGQSKPAVAKVAAVLVETKAKWSDPWKVNHELVCTYAKASGTSLSVGEARFERAYGSAVKAAHQTSFAERPHLDLAKTWVRLRLSGQEGNPVCWVGRIVGQPRELYGKADAPTGIQQIVAYDSLHLLDRIKLARSIWRVDDSTTVRLGWLPSFNLRGDDVMLRGHQASNDLVGNRSATVIGGTYVFGGSSLWTLRDMATYLLERFVDESGNDELGNPYSPKGPLWVLGGQAALLDSGKDLINLEIGDSVLEIIRRIIHHSRGLDFKIVYLPGDASGNGEGFELQVYSTLAAEVTFGGVTLSQNGKPAWRFDISDMSEFKHCVIVPDEQQRVGRIRVRSKMRAIVCCSIEAANLDGKWAESLKARYLAGAGSAETEAAEHDKARMADEFESVFQAFGAIADWDFNSGLATPSIDGEGNFEQSSNPNFQVLRRSTLNWTPLQSGWAYGSGVPVRQADADESEFLPPQAWVYDEDAQRYVPADQAGFDIAPLVNEWGLKLNGKPNHLLARGHFADAAATDTEPLYDWTQLILTFALETDVPLELVSEIDDWRPSDGEMVIEVDGVECWFVAPDTMYGVDAQGQQLRSNSFQRTVIRNDIDRLYMRMAGAIARYMRPRNRAEIRMGGLHAVHMMLGQLLSVVEAGPSDSQQVNAPISEVEWTPIAERPETVIRAGYTG